MHGLVGHDSHGVAFDAAVADHHVLRVEGLHFQEVGASSTICSTTLRMS